MDNVEVGEGKFERLEWMRPARDFVEICDVLNDERKNLSGRLYLFKQLRLFKSS